MGHKVFWVVGEGKYKDTSNGKAGWAKLAAMEEKILLLLYRCEPESQLLRGND